MRTWSSTIRAQVVSLGSVPQACSAACNANLGLMQGQNMPPAGLHFVGLCIGNRKLIAFVRDCPLGNGNRAIQPYRGEVGANGS